jgi:hypothetical protein
MVLPAMQGLNAPGAAAVGGEAELGARAGAAPAAGAATPAAAALKGASSPTVVGMPSPFAAGARGGASETVVGLPSPVPMPGASTAPARAAGAVTQLGILDPHRALGPSGAGPGAPGAPAPGGAAASGGGVPGRATSPAAVTSLGLGGPAALDAKSTVLGLGQGAMPAQLRSTSLGLGQAAPPSAALAEAGASAVSPGAPAEARNSPRLAERRTLPGVAIPGVAPMSESGNRERPSDRPAPRAGGEAPGASGEAAAPVVRLTSRGGATWAWALGGAAVIAVGGVAAALLVPGSAPLRAEVRLDETGRDVLRVTCAKCPDGTTLSAAGGATVVTSAGVADLPLGAPLRVGMNEVDVAVDRPGAGRDERVALGVPLAFRIWTDLRALQDPKPSIAVMVEALPGSAVTLQGRPVTLDAEGRGRETFDVRDELRGARTEPATLGKQIPYTVAPRAGRLETGSVDVRVGVVPLAIESVGPRLVTDRPTFLLAGRTAKGAGVSVGGRALAVQSDGSFVQWMSISDEGTSEIEVRAAAPPMAPRLVPVTVTRVRSLADEAKRREQLPSPGYAEVAAAPEASVGRAVAWRGEVVEAANQGQRTVAVVNVRTGCEAPPCPVRAELAGTSAVARGDKVGLYGPLGGFVPLRDGRVPEIAPEFFVKY